MKSRNNRFILSAASALLLAPTAFAANTWNGGGTPDGNWSNPANWGGATPDYLTALTFAGTTNLITNNDSATTSVVGLTFSSGADPFTLNGSSVTLGGNITNNSTSLQTINLPLVLNASRTIFTASGNMTLGGPISGAFSLIKASGNTLTMNTAGSSFSLFQLNTGTARLGVNDALPTTAGVTFSTGVAATLNLNGKTQTLGGAVTVAGSAGTVTISDTAGGGLLKMGGNVVQNPTGSPTVTISAALDLNGATRTFSMGNTAGIITVSGSISNSTGTAGLTKAGAGPGELILSGVNTYNGDTRATTGLLTLSNPLALQNSTLDTTNSIASSSATTGLKTTVSTLTLGGISGNKNLATLFDATNGYSGVTALTLNPASGQTPSHSGVIADGRPAIDGGTSLTKSGAGSQTLSGPNTYTGGTIISGGTLNYGNATALSNGAISFTGNSTLQAGVATTLANNISVASGFTGTVNTNGNATTLGGILTGDGNLTKTGAGTLIISGGAAANTLAGAISVNEGTLSIDQVNPSPAIQSFANMNGDVTVASGATFNFSQSFTTGAENNLDNDITLGGPGTGGLGALNLWRNATATGTITLADNATISHNFNTATISGPINGTNRNLALTTITAGQAGMTISGPITLGTGGITVTGVVNSGNFSIKLSGNNSYSGDTRVTSGTLMLSGVTRVPDASTVRIDTGAVLHLDFTGTDTVAALFLPGDPNPKPIGTYGSLASSATNKSADFLGDGILQVGGGANNFASWASSQAPPVTGGANGDDNNNGVQNLVEYALTDGGERGVFSGNTITFTKRGLPYGNDLTYIIETSETLSGSWSPEVTHGPAQLGSPISYNLNPVPGTPKKFARLKVVQLP